MTDEEDDDPWEELTPRRPGTPRPPTAASPPPGPGKDGVDDKNDEEGEDGEEEGDDDPPERLSPRRADGRRAAPDPVPDDDDPPETLSPRRPGEAPSPGTGPPPRLVRCAGCGRKIPPRVASCPVCAAPIADQDLTEDGSVSAALRFSGGLVQVRLRPGDVRNLGRDREWAPLTARGFADERSVSRRHAEVALRPDGTLWVTEYRDGTTHGTRVNGEYLLPAVTRQLADGDRLVLGLHSEATVSLCAPGEDLSAEAGA
ncbi:FHA domain-containing protein [Streptomyces phaeochromogenes]|uniref:FHA domain-containing protein n=1 Tax=Streptomyces phaeochromogenes TaxID=1923 RepID=UPI003866A88D|nr:FHA domain-containing protein [Streptomyces phaeochromogenes]